MIAWNGFEKARRNLDIVQPDDVFNLKVSVSEPIGEDISDIVLAKNIKCKRIPIL